jgi:hypothetical protein
MAKRPKLDVMESLEEHGYVVIENVVDDGEADRLATLFWEYMDALTLGRLRRDDPSTTTDYSRPMHSKGMITHYNCGLQRYAIESRMACRKVFAALWGTDRLWTSFEGTVFSRRPERYPNKSLLDWKAKQWKEALVVTQTAPGLLNVQGMMSLTTQHEHEHVFVCVPGAHKVHEQLVAMEPVTKVNHVVLSDAQKAFLAGYEVKRVVVPKGSMVLWDSRLPHGTASYCKEGADPQTCRVAVAVSMRPALEDNPVLVKRREHCFAKGLVTAGFVDNLQWFPEKPHTHGKRMAEFAVPPSDQEMSDEEKRLHGLLPY